MSDILQALRETTVLARVHTSALGIKRTDRNASEQVIKDANAVRGAATVQVSRIAGGEAYHRDIVAVQQRARVVLFNMSSPFRDDGWRILPSVKFMDFVQQYSKVKKDFDKVRQRMLDAADEILFKAKTNAGHLHTDLPSIEEITGAYRLGFDVQDYPLGKFEALPDATVASLQRAMNKRAEEAWAEAKRDLLSRMIGPLLHFVDRAEAADERDRLQAGGAIIKAGAFRTSTIENIREVVTLAKAMNLDNDKVIADAVQQLEAFVTLDADDVRTDGALRKSLTSTARNAAANLQGWMK